MILTPDHLWMQGRIVQDDLCRWLDEQGINPCRTMLLTLAGESGEVIATVIDVDGEVNDHEIPAEQVAVPGLLPVRFLPLFSRTR